MARILTITFWTLLSAFCLAAAVGAQTTAFTFQGSLKDGATAANGNYDFEFALFDAVSGGSQIGSTLPRNAVAVTNGLFSASLDFGSQFPGANRFLEIRVRLSGGGGLTTLTPRQPINSVPYSVKSVNADNATQLGSVPASGYLQSSGGTITGNLTVNGVLSGNGSGLTNLPGAGGIFPWLEVTKATQQAQSNTGYFANSSSEVAITLPASPNIFDIVRVTGAGAGGWKIAQNAGQSIVTGNLGQIGVNWVPRDSVRAWSTVASSADGSKLVAAPGDNGRPIYISTNYGRTWTALPSPTRAWASIASSADGTKLVAVISNMDQIYTSTNSGGTWTAREGNRNWTSVASSADGTNLVAVADSARIFTSTNSGATWTPRDSQRLWKAVASSADGSKLVAAENPGQIYTSTNFGVSWTARGSIGVLWQSIASSADGNNLVAVVQGGQIYTSTNSGVSWTARYTSENWASVTSSADGSRLAAVSTGGRIHTSTNYGLDWEPHESIRGWSAVASSADGTKLVAVEDGGLIYTSGNTTLGATGYLSGGQFTSIELQYIGNSQFLPLSHEGRISIF